MQIDCYGFEASSQWFRRKELEVYLMKEVEGILYLCYGNQPMRPIAPPPPLAGCRVATVLASLEGSLRKRCGIPQRFLRRIPALTTTNTVAHANRGRLDTGRTSNRCATFPSTRRWKLTRKIGRRPDESDYLPAVRQAGFVLPLHRVRLRARLFPEDNAGEDPYPDNLSLPLLNLPGGIIERKLSQSKGK